MPASRPRLAGLPIGNVAVAAALGMVLWEGGRLIPPLHRFPASVEVAGGLWQAVVSGVLPGAVATTLHSTAVALALAATVGLPGGLLLAASPALERHTRTVVEFSRSVPAIVLMPIAVVIVGIGFQMRILVAAFAGVWPILFHTKAGAETIDTLQVESARALGSRGLGLVAHVLAPACLPHVMTGLRLAASTVLVVVITVEMLVGHAAPGLGGQLEYGRQGGDAAHVWAMTVASGIVGLGLNLMLLGAQRRVMPWSTSILDPARC